MSTTIDERVLEMRFDNRQFENNVSNTMSTLDKLKQKLNFTGASKGLENVNAAAKNVNMTGLGSAVETVSAKFSALQIMGVTALANITNSAVNAGKRIVSALTIDPVKTGFQEYETQINAVQTILANTSSKGTTIDDVNRALEELNKYADMTIYNFTEMTRNIGTFTAAGIDLDTSVNAIQGIANLAAVSGSTSQQASTAMYQLSQALAAGTVKLMDWNSVVNAGMGGEVFQNALKETSKELGTGAEAAIKASGSFRESLKDGWLTSEVLTETLKKFTSSGANEYVATYTGLSVDAVESALKMAEATYGEADAIEHASKALAEKSGKNADEIADILNFAKTATDAATKVKTFTQLWDVLKESAQSGWSQTWKIIVGDFEEAKSLLTPLADFLTGIINKMSDFRNNILESALGRSIGSFGDKINEILKPVSKATEAIRGTVDTITDLGEIVDNVIRGDFGNGVDRFNALTEAGINYYEVQNKVNEKLGDGYRYTQEQIDAQNKLLGAQTKTTEKTEGQKDATVKLTDKQREQLKTLGKMNYAQLQAAGYSEAQIKALEELKKTAEDLGIPFDEFIDNLDQLNGRWLLINSFKNIGNNLVDIGKAIGSAWKDIFPEHNVENFADKLFNILASFHKFTVGIAGAIHDGEKFTETGDNLVRTLKGVFAILDIITTVAGGGLKIAFKILNEILGRFDLNILDVTAAVADAIVKFRDWVDSVVSISDIVDVLVPVIKTAAEHVKIFVDAFKGSEDLASFVDRIQGIVSAIKEWLSGLRGSDNIPRDIIAGLAKGIREGAPEVIAAMFDLAKAVVDGICAALGIHSPSTVMIAIGGFIIAGLIVGLQNGFGELWNTLGDIAKNIFDWAKSLDFGTIFAIAIGVGMTALIAKIAKMISDFSSPLNGLGDALEGLGDMFEGIGASFKAKKWESIGNAVKSFAIAIGILAASVYVLAQLDTADLLGAIGAIAALAVIVGVLSAAIGKFGPTEPLKLAGLSFALLGLAASILIISNAVKNLGSLEPEQMKQAFLGLAGVIAAIAIVFAAYGLLVKGKSAQNIDKLGGMLLKLSITMLLMIGVVKLASKVTDSELIAAGKFAGGFLVFALGMQLIGLIPSKNISKLGGMLLKMSIAMLLMVGVVKLANKVTDSELIAAGKFAGGILAFMLGIQLIGLIPGNNISKLGGTLLKMSMAMLLMIGVVKLANKLTNEELLNAAKFVGGFLVFVLALRLIALIPGGDMSKLGTTLLAMAVAIGILAGVVALMGMLSPEQLTKGLVAVTVLGLVMTAMIWASRGASKCVSNLVVMTVAIALMATAVAALSMIDGTKLWSATLALSLVMGMFALVIKSGSNITSSVGPLIAMTVAVGLIGGVIYLLSGLPVESVIGTALSLSVLLLAMSGVLAILSVIKLSATEALIGILALTALAIPMLAFVGVLALMSKIENATANANALTKMMTTMTLLLIPLTIVGFLWPAAAAGLIALTAMVIPMLAFVGVLALMSEINMATENINLLTSMMVTMTGLLTHLALIGPMALIGVAAMAGLSLLIVEIGLLAVGIGALMEKFPALQDFLNTGIPVLEQLAEAIGTMIGKFIDGILTEATANLGTVADNLSSFISKLEPFITGVSSIDPNFKTNVTTLIDTISSLIKAEIFGTLASWLPGGDDTLSNFATQLKTLGTGLKDYVKETEGVSAESISQSVAAAKELIGLGNMLPEDGIFGTDGIDDFGRNAVSFAKSLKKYSEKAAEIDTESISKSVIAARSLMNIAKLVPDDGTFGTDGIDDFGKNIVSFGKSIKKYSEKVAEVDSGAITSSAAAIKRVVGVINSLTSLDTSGISSFKSAINTLSKTNIDGFVNTFKSAASKLTSVGSNMIDSVVKGMKSKTSQFKAVASTIINSVSQAIKSKTSAFNQAGSGLANALVKGIGSRRGAVRSALVATISTAISSIRSYYNRFYSAGSYLVSGFAAGISANSFKAAAKAAAMANAAEKAARDALDINSPSKVFRAIGMGIPEGFIQGIDELSGSVGKSVTGMADKAIYSVGDTISKLATLINTDIDAQPTIRPVLDLSDVKAGAASIGNLFNTTSQVGVMANINSLGGMMGRYGQNGGNNDIVDAIDKLRKDLGNISGDTYSVGNVTYDDGSNIATAVKQLTRAAIRERRV